MVGAGRLRMSREGLAVFSTEVLAGGGMALQAISFERPMLNSRVDHIV